ncbi:tetratricopeptide repeat protein [Rhodoferax antarcticus]|uniref:tetratricopeptide repeat protein n=1 Tax=Rhodoferax antarcticus TaxID=81479 RepID=UPI002224BEFB|nr:tetratricopeptide repeat protein [Rhodoferax antarcticus]MCW2314351.1 tetratricopeptide (TPR) repeat protein [Rhodoferax antarcticus]
MASLIFGSTSQAALTATPLAVPLMVGSLDVQEQKGLACDAPANLPLRLPVWATWKYGQWWVWGDMAPMRMHPMANPLGNRSELQLWADDTPQGQAHWLTEPPPIPAQLVASKNAKTVYTAQWQESETPKGCAFTQATLNLSAWSAPTSVQGLSSAPTSLDLMSHQRLLSEALAQWALLKKSTSPSMAVAPLKHLTELAQEAANNPTARRDRNLALTWLQASEHASALRQHNEALLLVGASVAVYEPLAATSPQSLQDAALALASLARSQGRAGMRDESQATLSKALALLDQHLGARTAAAANLHNQQGAFWLRQRQPQQALRSFTQALDADEAASASPTERVATLMNSAVALEELGQPQAARSVYERCQQLLTAEPASPDSERLKEWVQARLRALSNIPSSTSAT